MEYQLKKARTHNRGFKKSRVDVLSFICKTTISKGAKVRRYIFKCPPFLKPCPLAVILEATIPKIWRDKQTFLELNLTLKKFTN